MALWIHNRPVEHCHAGELETAEFLALLSDDWLVRWGYFYLDESGVQREGDFLILGPHGGLLVLEVKSGSLDHWHGNGQWNTHNGDNPMSQLDREWSSVVDEVRSCRGEQPSLYVDKAIALPDIEIAPDLDSYHGISRQHLLGRSELVHFARTWERRFHSSGIHPDRRSREIFFATRFGREAKPKAVRHFTDEIDRRLARQTEANYELLDQLALNRQMIFQGGPGSGKTWMALEQAFRCAEQGPEGSKVLLLAYNLSLADQLKLMVEKAAKKNRPARGEVVARSWEELVQEIFRELSLPYEVPEDSAAKLDFYTREVPEILALGVAEGQLPSRFDALVVDEGQDHNTALYNAPAGFSGAGWWGIYFGLLRDGASSPVAVFLDEAQRPAFRGPGGFDLEVLTQSLAANPVRVQLTRSLRYTREILDYFKTLEAPGTVGLVAGLRASDKMAHGPSVEILGGSPDKVPQLVDELIQRWLDHGLCRPEEILILSPHAHETKSCLPNIDQIGGCFLRNFSDLRKGCVARSSIHKAKGLDSRAVILIDYPSFSQIDDEEDQMTFFLGASRARQLLAVVEIIQKA